MKDTILRRNFSINCGGKLLSLENPVVMGIINVTPDSFYDGGKNNNIHSALLQAETHLQAGASILDIGGYSSKPGATKISEAEELQRVAPVISALKQEFPESILSIDTFRSEVAKESCDLGTTIINDISAGELDSKMFDIVGELQVPYIMMHMQNTPQNMQDNPVYDNILNDITTYFVSKIKTLREKGANDILVDVGFGFGKTLEDNYKLLRNLDHFQLLQVPILTGISRKSMLYKPLGINPENALNATTAAHMIALEKGTKILRVHDVKEAMEAIKIHQLLQD